MIQGVLLAWAGEERSLAGLPAPLPVDELVPGGGPWEVELGFGKGRYLLQRAQAAPERRFLGVERASKYYRLLARRAGRLRVGNLLALRGEALYLLSAVLPSGFATAVHVYFPDPWPKARHHKRRLFDPETVDLVLGLLAPGGELFFATDFLDYGELVVEILEAYPGLVLHRLPGGWPEGPRTNYEAKYVAEGRAILRLMAHLDPSAGLRAGSLPLHPRGATRVVAARGGAE